MKIFQNRYLGSFAGLNKIKYHLKSDPRSRSCNSPDLGGDDDGGRPGGDGPLPLVRRAVWLSLRYPSQFSPRFARATATAGPDSAGAVRVAGGRAAVSRSNELFYSILLSILLCQGFHRTNLSPFICS